MALQTSGQISLNDIQGEFGGSNPIEIDEYYRGGGRVPNIPANSNVPTSGTIALSNFYGAFNGVEITIDLVGGGGGGGLGFNDAGSGSTGTGGSGGASTIVNDSDGSSIASASGGAGGGDGQGTEAGSGGDGGPSPITGGFGAGGAVNQYGSDCAITDWGGGGGGGGGDASSKGDSAGFSGAGGAAGAQTTGTYVVTGMLRINLGGGGIGTKGPAVNNVNYNGGDGAPGYCNITSSQALGGNATFSDNTTRGSSGPYYYMATIPDGAYSVTISSSAENLDLRTAAVNAGWNQSSPLYVTIGSGVYCWSNRTDRGGIEISGTFPGGLIINNDGYIMGRGGNASAGAGGPAIRVTSNDQAISVINGAGYIGGGGGAGRTNGGGGGGGAGGGRGGNSNIDGRTGGAGGTIGNRGGNGGNNFTSGANGGYAGGGGGGFSASRSGQHDTGGGGGGGRIMPGQRVNGTSGFGSNGEESDGGYGGGPGENGGNSTNGGSRSGGGGGGWGGAGGENGGAAGSVFLITGTGNSVGISGNMTRVYGPLGN